MNEAPASNVVIATIAGAIAGLGTWVAAIVRFRRANKQVESKQEVGLLSLGADFSEKIMTRYAEQVKELDAKVRFLESELAKVQTEILEMAQRHLLELAAAEARHKIEVAALEARYTLANTDLENRYQKRVEELSAKVK